MVETLEVFENEAQAVHALTHDRETGEETGWLGVPCSRYGSTGEECAPVAWRVAEIIAHESTGEPVSWDELDSAMSLVVNDSDEPAYMLAHYGTDEERETWAPECYGCDDETHGQDEE